MRFMGRLGGAAPISNCGRASGCVFPLRVLTCASLIGCVISGCGASCWAVARTEKAENNITKRQTARGGWVPMPTLLPCMWKARRVDLGEDAATQDSQDIA